NLARHCLDARRESRMVVHQKTCRHIRAKDHFQAGDFGHMGHILAPMFVKVLADGLVVWRWGGVLVGAWAASGDVEPWVNIDKVEAGAAFANGRVSGLGVWPAGGCSGPVE